MLTTDLPLRPDDDLREVIEIPYLHLDGHLGKVRGTADHAHVVDVAVGFADKLGDLRKGARLVERDHRQLGREPFRHIGIDIPGHVDPSLVLVVPELWRVDLEDADALAFRQHADDAITGQRAAILERYGHVVADTANGQHLLLRLPVLAAAARPAELEADTLGDIEPAVLALGAAGPAWPAACRRMLCNVRFRHRRSDHVVDRQLAAAHAGKHLLDRLLCEAVQPLLDLVVREFLTDPAECRHQQSPAELRILLAQGLARRAADGRSRLAGDGDALPCGRRRLALGGQHVHLVAVPELRCERHLPPVDHCPHAGIADVGMHRIGKVDRRCAARQSDQTPLRREAEHLVLEQLELGMLQKFLGVVALQQRIDETAQPDIGILLRKRSVGGRAIARGVDPILVKRVRGHTVFGDVVHLAGADLQLDALVPGTDDGRMDRLVVVLLGRRNVILELSRVPRARLNE